MTPSKAIADAILIIQANGWCQYDFENHNGAHCLVGAINHSIFNDSNGEGVCEARDRIDLKFEVNDRIFTRVGCSPISWNDTPGRTEKDVVDLLDRVRTEFEAEGQ